MAITSATVGTTLLSAYLAAVTIAGRSRSRVKNLPSSQASHRFAILVPAHNEELTIERALRSFADLDYPRDQFEVHVVTDNCTDDTAGVVRRSGFGVHERLDPETPGKGPALNWLSERLRDSGCNADIAVIVDADSTLDQQFLHAMSAAFDRGARAAQGFYAVSDPETSTAASLRWAALACRHHLRPLGRQALGGSCGLYGNGMAFDWTLMKDRQWSGHLTEDAEFQLKLLLDSERVVYVPAALLHAEMPQTLDDSTTQNERWELGRLQLAKRYLPTLARRAVTGPHGLRPAYLDAAFDQLLPPLSVLAAADLACLTGSAAMVVFGSGRAGRVNLVMATCCSVALVGHVWSGLRSVDAPRSAFVALLRAPKLIAWKLALWLRVLARPSSVKWQRTKRIAEAA